MTLDSYKVFHTVANEKQISRAAKTLFVTQSAVSQSIAQLESEIGCTLFERLPKGVRLTYEGQRFYNEINKGFLCFEKAEQEIEKLLKVDKGEIIIGAGDSVCSHYLLDQLAMFRHNYPDIVVHIYNKTSSQVIAMLDKGEIDIGFVNYPVQSEIDFDVLHVMDLEDGFVCSPSFGLDLDKNYSLNEIIEHPLVLLEEGTNMRRYFESITGSLGIDVSPSYEVGSADLLLSFAGKGFGIAFITKEFCKKAIDSGEVVLLKLNHNIPKRSIGMLTRKSKGMSVAITKLYEMISQQVK